MGLVSNWSGLRTSPLENVILCPETKTIADEHQYADVALAIQQENLDSALALWSRAAENSLFELLRPEKHHLANNAVSRCGGFRSVRTSLCEPRLKAGRPGDFQLAGDTGTPHKSMCESSCPGSR